MRVVETKVFPFDELSDEAKKAALIDMININFEGFEWWDMYYDSAADTEKFKITAFDCDRGSYVHGEFINGALETAKAIIKNHGEVCDSYKLASKFITDYMPESNTDDEDEELENDFKQALLDTHLVGLRAELSYRYSDEAIKETIEANEYEFLECGTHFTL